ncbi:uncharacterized protein V1516DRAFT_683020 [Lipomyces oligophaga]|uniref:uncharacterized protein n=1 Tax=Lipomyces oligophaga TaxID=45792 RepID=UPI0034CF61D0
MSSFRPGLLPASRVLHRSLTFRKSLPIQTIIQQTNISDLTPLYRRSFSNHPVNEILKIGSYNRFGLAHSSSSSTILSNTVYSNNVIHRRSLTYYGKSKDDIFLYLRSSRYGEDHTTRTALALAQQGLWRRTKWIFRPMIFGCLITLTVFGGLLVISPPMDYPRVVGSFASFDVLTGGLEKPTGITLYETVRTVLRSLPKQVENGDQVESQLADRTYPVTLAILGASALYTLFMRIGPLSVREFLIRFGYLRSDVFASLGGRSSREGRYLSILISPLAHRNIWHFALSASLFGLIGSNVEVLSGSWNVAVIFLGGALESAIGSMLVNAILKRPAMPTLGLLGPASALWGFFMMYECSVAGFLSVIDQLTGASSETEEERLSRVQDENIQQQKNESLVHGLIQTVLSKTKDKDENFIVTTPGSKKHIVVVLNKSPLNKSDDESEPPSTASQIFKQPPEEANMLLQFNVHPPQPNRDSLLIFGAGLLFGAYCLVSLCRGPFVIPASSGVMTTRFLYDNAANLAALAFGMEAGAMVHSQFENSKIIFAVVPVSMLPDYLREDKELDDSLFDWAVGDDEEVEDNEEVDEVKPSEQKIRGETQEGKKPPHKSERDDDEKTE